MNRFVAHSAVVLANFIGGGSLLFFGAFPITGPFTTIRFDASEAQGLLWDGFLSLAFFIQHSGMIRPSFRTRLSFAIPPHYHPATYAIASGAVLTTVVLLWQPSQTVLVEIQDPLHVLLRALFFLAMAGFVWGVWALRPFDPFGQAPIASVSAASHTEHHASPSGVPISGSANRSISSCLFSSGQPLA